MNHVPRHGNCDLWVQGHFKYMTLWIKLALAREKKKEKGRVTDKAE